MPQKTCRVAGYPIRQSCFEDEGTECLAPPADPQGNMDQILYIFNTSVLLEPISKAPSMQKYTQVPSHFEYVVKSGFLLAVENLEIRGK